MTLRVRFALWIAGLLLVVLAAFGVFVYYDLSRGLSDSLDDSLRLGASQAIATINVVNGQIDFSDSLPEGENNLNLQERDLTVRILDPQGQILHAFGPYQDMPVDTGLLASVQTDGSIFTNLHDPLDDDAVRVYSAPILENGQIIGIVQVAQSMGDITDTLHRLMMALLLGGPLLVVLACLGGYYLAQRALAPIDAIARTARDISAEDLSLRLNLPPTKDEVGRLAATFDEMLARLEDAFHRERQFTADASHELRTPLAAVQAILSVIREKRRTPEDYEHALADISEETNRLGNLVEDLLQLARGDLRQPLLRQPVDISALLPDVTEALRPLAEAKGLALTCEVPPGLSISGDSDGLIRLFVNLIDNALKYTDRGEVSVAARAEGRRLSITIRDTGSGIPAEHLPHIFDRFYRVDASRSSRGSGLGLAIALEIAKAHGGTIEVHSVVGEGSVFTVTLDQA